MKVKDLKNTLTLVVGEGREGQLLVSISHWVNKIRTGPKQEYQATLPQDITALKKLEELKIVEITKESTAGMTVSLTPAGRELYKDFIAHGYF